MIQHQAPGGCTESVKRYLTNRLIIEGHAEIPDGFVLRVVQGHDFDRVSAEREALQLLLNERDEQVHSLEQRRQAEQQACQAAERRVDALRRAISARESDWLTYFESVNEKLTLEIQVLRSRILAEKE